MVAIKLTTKTKLIKHMHILVLLLYKVLGWKGREKERESKEEWRELIPHKSCLCFIHSQKQHLTTAKGTITRFNCIIIVCGWSIYRLASEFIYFTVYRTLYHQTSGTSALWVNANPVGNVSPTGLHFVFVYVAEIQCRSVSKNKWVVESSLWTLPYDTRHACKNNNNTWISSIFSNYSNR